MGVRSCAGTPGTFGLAGGRAGEVADPHPCESCDGGTARVCGLGTGSGWSGAAHPGRSQWQLHGGGIRDCFSVTTWDLTGTV